MSAQSGMSYPFLRSVSLIPWHAFASFIPTTVNRTRSKPSSAHRMIWSAEPSTSLVSVVAMVWRTSGCSLPNLTDPAVTVRVFRRVTLYRSSQYWPTSPNARSRGVWPGSPRAEGVQMLDMVGDGRASARGCCTSEPPESSAADAPPAPSSTSDAFIFGLSFDKTQLSHLGG